MDAGKRSINDIFNGNRVLEIPFFQRAYVWGEEQWERLLEDMEAISLQNKPYFLGSVILKQQETGSDTNVGDKRTLIDGQQRLTTLNIFIKVLCLKIEKNSSFDRRFRLENEELALWHNHNDIAAFEQVLNLESLEELPGDDQITNAYKYFKDHIDQEKLDRQRILNNIVFVGIDLGKEEDEQQIFDTINSLGVRLTTAELLKNYLFNRDDTSLYDDYWKSVFESDLETKKYWDKEITTGRVKRTFIDLFFYAFLQIKSQDPSFKVKSEDKIEYSRVDSLFESYKDFVKKHQPDKQQFLNEIKTYAELFAKYFNVETVEKELSPDIGIDRINAIIFGLETSTLIPYVLYLLKNVKDETQRNEVFSLLESYVMRRIVVKANNKNYNQFFTDQLVGNNITTVSQLKELFKTLENKVNYFPSDHDLLKGFQESVLINRTAAGIIYLLESKIRNNNRHSTQLLGLRKYSLEHLMPKKWINNWSKPTEQGQIDKRNRKLRTLGNLAIITQSLNASIRDGDWNTKVNGSRSKKGLRHYSGGIETLSSYLELEEWNEETIESRGNDLYQIAKKVWPSE